MSAVFTISTAEVPTIPFEVKDSTGTHDYQLRTMAHLSPEEEADVKYLFKRDDDLQADFRKTPGRDREKRTAITNKLREIRFQLIGILSDIPEATYRKFNIMQQGKILGYIGRDPEDVLKEAAEEDGSDIAKVGQDNAEADEI